MRTKRGAELEGHYVTLLRELLIALLIDHWGLLDQPLLCLSVAFRRAQPEYYARLTAVRIDGYCRVRRSYASAPRQASMMFAKFVVLVDQHVWRDAVRSR